jgi:hypothetical protein
MTTTSLFTCPTCGDHAVEVTSAGFSATTATVTGCPVDGPRTVRASEPAGWSAWLADGVRHVDGLVVFTGAIR